METAIQAEAWDDVLLQAAQAHELLMQALEHLTRSPTSSIYAEDGKALQNIARAALAVERIMDLARPF